MPSLHRLRRLRKCERVWISAIHITEHRPGSFRAVIVQSRISVRRPSREKRSRWSVGTAHEAFLKTLFTEAELRPYPDADAARFALKRGEVDLLFGDGVSLAFWLNGTDSANCCVFRGGPYLESRFFGEGVGIVVTTRQRFVAAGLQLGAVPAVGKGTFHRPVAALFSGQSVLNGKHLTSPRGISSVRAPENDVCD